MSSVNMLKPCVARLPCARAHALQRAQQPRLAVRGFDPKFEGRMVGDDFGARDPTVGEKESNFSEKVLWNYDTDHLMRAPSEIGQFVGLSSKNCEQLEEGCVALSPTDYERLRQQVPGWRVITSGEPVVIRQDFKCQSAEKAAELKGLIEGIATEQGHPVDTRAVGSEAFAVLTTAAAGGLTLNDFIMASKINTIDTTEILAKKKTRYWA